MQIANPIYDVVFKYLMGDQKLAKIIISKIIGEEVESLELQPQEISAEIQFMERLGDSDDKKKTRIKTGVSIYRLDFAAKIRTEEGEMKTVIIELQKAKLPSDIIRFRKYIGMQYFTENNTEKISTNKHKAFPIISIYFLDHPLNIHQIPVIKVDRVYSDLATGEILQGKEEFIESLTHDSYIIQTKKLKNHRRTELEKILSIFDQSQIDIHTKHILNIHCVSDFF